MVWTVYWVFRYLLSSEGLTLCRVFRVPAERSTLRATGLVSRVRLEGLGPRDYGCESPRLFRVLVSGLGFRFQGVSLNISLGNPRRLHWFIYGVRKPFRRTSKPGTQNSFGQLLFSRGRVKSLG